MKRILCLTALLVLLVVPVVLGSQMEHVYDLANHFTAEQQATLNERMLSIHKTYDFDMIIITTQDSRGQSARMFAADFFDSVHDYDQFANGLAFSFNFDLGEYTVVTRGIAQTIFSDSGENDLDRVLRPHLSDKDYFGAMTSYLQYVEERLNRYSTADESGVITLSTQKQTPSLSKALQQASQYILYMLGGGGVIGLGSALVMKGRLLIAKPQISAQQYARQGSMNLRESSDIFLHQTVTRTRIQQNKSGGGGGRSGGFRSSGGGSYGSRGGKL